MVKSKNTLRKEFGLTEKNLSKEELEVLKIKDVIEEKYCKEKPEIIFGVHGTEEANWMKDKMMIDKLGEATRDGICVITGLIDKQLPLSYPLNDSKTSPTLRQVYIEQEALMIDKFMNTPMSEWGNE